MEPAESGRHPRVAPARGRPERREPEDHEAHPHHPNGPDREGARRHDAGPIAEEPHSREEIVETQTREHEGQDRAPRRSAGRAQRRIATRNRAGARRPGAELSRCPSRRRASQRTPERSTEGSSRRASAPGRRPDGEEGDEADEHAAPARNGATRGRSIVDRMNRRSSPGSRLEAASRGRSRGRGREDMGTSRPNLPFSSFLWGRAGPGRRLPGGATRREQARARAISTTATSRWRGSRWGPEARDRQPRGPQRDRDHEQQGTRTKARPFPPASARPRPRRASCPPAAGV